MDGNDERTPLLKIENGLPPSIVAGRDSAKHNAPQAKVTVIQDVQEDMQGDKADLIRSMITAEIYTRSGVFRGPVEDVIRDPHVSLRPRIS